MLSAKPRDLPKDGTSRRYSKGVGSGELQALSVFASSAHFFSTPSARPHDGRDCLLTPPMRPKDEISAESVAE